MKFRLEVEFAGDTSIIKANEVDVYTAPRLQQAFADIAETGRNKVVFDMSELEYIDLTAARVLISERDKCFELGGDVYLVKPIDSILKLIEIACFGASKIAVLNLFPTVERAINEFGRTEARALCLAV